MSFKDLLGEMNKSTRPLRFLSSKEFKEVQKALQDVVSLSDASVDKKSAMDMAEAHGRLGKACDTYIKTRTGASTDKGKDRLELVGIISDLQKKETDGVNAMRNPSTLNDNKGKKWSEVLATQRAREMDVTGKKLSTVGAGSSTRTVVPLEDGKKGFFTEDQTVLSREDFYQERSRTAKSENVKKAYEILWKDASTCNGLGDMAMRRLNADDPYADMEKAMGNEYKDLSEKIGWNDICENPQDKLEFLRTMIENARLDTTRDLMCDGGMKMGGSMSVRNVASSRLAALLGQDTLLAKSEVVCLRNGNEIQKGVMMEEAMGLDIKSERHALTFAKVNDFSTPDLQRQVTSLEVLDYLSAQIDRHGANMFYQFEKDAAGNQKLVGIQGIDNDAAFGTITSQTGLNMINISAITMIDETLAANIRNVNQADLEYVFGDLLDAEEIEALGKRFNQVKEQIESEKVRTIKPNEWNARTAKEILDKPGYLKRMKDDFEYIQSKLPAMERETAGKETKERVTTKDLQEEKKNRIPKLGAYRENKVKELKTPVLQRNR
ncbi:MAG: hypothetical protein LUE86_03040 [Clostridiales bacterium]|nr:hypothetical protein [Clostridiales bacterium]